MGSAPMDAATGSSGSGRRTRWSPSSSMARRRTPQRRRTVAGTEICPPFEILAISMEPMSHGGRQSSCDPLLCMRPRGGSGRRQRTPGRSRPGRHLDPCEANREVAQIRSGHVLAGRGREHPHAVGVEQHHPRPDGQRQSEDRCDARTSPAVRRRARHRAVASRAAKSGRTDAEILAEQREARRSCGCSAR